MSHPIRSSTRPGTTRRVRLKDYNYSTPGYYFVTICTQKRHHYLGSITYEHFDPTPAGEMVGQTILECTTRFDSVSIDSIAILPNHIHVLFGLAVRLTDPDEPDDLIDVIHWLKSTGHQRYREGIRKHDWPRYKGLVWQEGFYDHIVRNERELETLRTYILTNVERWEKDEFHDGFIDQ